MKKTKKAKVKIKQVTEKEAVEAVMNFNIPEEELQQSDMGWMRRLLGIEEEEDEKG